MSPATVIPLTGYVDRLSARPGETLDFKISSTLSAPFEAKLVRVISADPNPDGPGLREEDLSRVFQGHYASRYQDYRLGSYVRVPAKGALASLSAFTVVATVWPTTPDKGRQAIVSCCDPHITEGFSFGLDERGCVRLQLEAGEAAPIEVAVPEPLKCRRWYRVWASYDPSLGVVTVGQQLLEPHVEPQETQIEVMGGLRPASAEDVLIAACNDGPVADHFNGKIEAPIILGRALSAAEIVALVPQSIAAESLACWDFSHGISTLTVTDLGPNELHGEIVNLPVRGMKGSAWDGREMCWRHAPEQYGAIHFHDDDFYDCGWETDFSFTVPNDLRNGVYAMRLSCEGIEDTIPFFVCPPKGERQSQLCVVIPTFTYVIYSNNARYDFGEALKERMVAWGGSPWNPAEHPQFGLSTYNLHSDGSGICNVSSRRPMLNLRCGYLTLVRPRSGSGLRHFQADTHLLAWLEHVGLAYDVVTDQELHEEGVACLSGYKAVLTCTHPEYHTAETLNALRDYRDDGGHLVYLGGNGFYWRVALHREAPGAIEIRRGEGGLRFWAAQPGEYYNAFDGNYGGLWLRNGRAPQKLAGVGFTSQGAFSGSYYRRTPEGRDPSVAWIFEGIEEDIIGDFGLSGCGAAGYELDRVDHDLGSPDSTVILARSEGHDETFIPVPEDILNHVGTTTGERPEDLIRAEMVYCTLPGGGAVFSVGSITFCGSLPSNDFDNNVSRLLLNVLRRFLAD